MKIEITKKADKQIKEIALGNKFIGAKIDFFIKHILPNTENPRTLSNAKKMQGYNDNKHYRWRVENYRILGVINDDILEIEIFKVATRGDAYQK